MDEVLKLIADVHKRSWQEGMWVPYKTAVKMGIDQQKLQGGPDTIYLIRLRKHKILKDVYVPELINWS